MLTVHHLGVSQSERIVWLCEELQIPYALKRYERDAVTRMAPADYKALHMAGTSPVITDGDVTLGESAAIMEYIITKHGGGRLAVRPEDSNYAEYLYWFHFANGSMMPNELINLVVGVLGGAGAGAARSLMARSDSAYAMIDKRLNENPYFAGASFTAADIIMFFPLTTMRAFVPRDISAFSNIRSYLRRVGERPAYQRAMAKGDPGMSPFLE